VGGYGDEELILRIAGQDAAALTALYDRYGRIAFGLAYRIADDPATAEEVVQDAFMQVWRHAASFDGRRGSARAWLLTIVHHRAIDGRRRAAGRGREVAGLDDLEDALASPDLWAEVAARLQRDQVRSAIAALPDEQRRAIELAYFDGLTHREIAERTGQPLGTVKGRLRLGLRKLHGLLTEAAAGGPGSKSPSGARRRWDIDGR